MKTIHTAIAVAALLTSAGAHADTIATWTFEGSLPATSGPINPETGAGQASGSHQNAATVYSSPAGNGSSHSFSANLWNVGDFFQFKVDATSFQDLEISWDQISSNTGPRDFKLAYSTDGTNFLDFETYAVLANAGANVWSSGGAHNSAATMSADLSVVPSLNNAATLYFRLIDLDTTSANGGTVGNTGTNSGTDRVDNFTVTGVSSVPLPAAVWLLGSGLAALAGVRRRRPQ